MTKRISAALTKTDLTAMMAAITTIKTRLPFLLDLTTDERKALPKLGDKSRAFVSKALEVDTQNPDFLLRSRSVTSHSFDIDEMRGVATYRDEGDSSLYVAIPKIKLKLRFSLKLIVGSSFVRDS